MPLCTLRTASWILSALCLFAAGAARLDAQATGPEYRASPSVDRPAVYPDSIQPPTLRFDAIKKDVNQGIERLIREMTLDEKVGQLVQVSRMEKELSDEFAEMIRSGSVGSVFYQGDAELMRRAQQIAIYESRLGIPLLVCRDVVHGFRTVAPIPLGQAASWNPDLVEEAARIAACEAKAEGIDWTFAPMVDICRDPRWGRIAESLGEDPVLGAEMAAAMVRGFQQEEDGKVTGVIACAKHFAGYGFAEGGRDYNRVSVSGADLHNTILPPFRTSVDAGCRTIMTTFSEINGVPGTAHKPLVRGVLKGDWAFSGLVVSDWGSVSELVVHGYAEDERHAARSAILAGVDMDMCGPSYTTHLKQLVLDGEVSQSTLDDAVRRVLRCKAALPRTPERNDSPRGINPQHANSVRQLARQSIVMLKNDGLLPLESTELSRVAVIGPMADNALQQLGCWVLDGRPEECVTPLADLRKRLGDKIEVTYTPGAKNTFSNDDALIADAVRNAKDADVALIFLGEDTTLSGEARSRANISLPGVQEQLIQAVTATGAPTALVIMAGRPLAIGAAADSCSAVFYAWHPGSQGGPAINDLLLGAESPSGKLPVTFPKSVGQVPLYYSRHNTGRPTDQGYVPLIGSDRDDLQPDELYHSHYLDIDPFPLYCFGYGLSYTNFEYSDLRLTSPQLTRRGVLSVSVKLTNTGKVVGEEVSQLYVRDRSASIVRPVRELKAHRRTRLAPGESVILEFALPAKELGYYDNDGQYVLEPGSFDVWLGSDSRAKLTARFELIAEPAPREPILPEVRGVSQRNH